MRWKIKQIDSQIYWQQNAGQELGVSGMWTTERRLATRFTDNERLIYLAEKGDLPHGFEWAPVIERHSNAIEMQSTVNPAGVALALHEAYCEVIAEGGDTAAQKADPACRLILHHLTYLADVGGGLSLTDYRMCVEHCEAKAKEEK